MRFCVLLVALSCGGTIQNNNDAGTDAGLDAGLGAGDSGTSQIAANLVYEYTVSADCPNNDHLAVCSKTMTLPESVSDRLMATYADNCSVFRHDSIVDIDCKGRCRSEPVPCGSAERYKINCPSLPMTDGGAACGWSFR